jgi:hypothetical protein
VDTRFAPIALQLDVLAQGLFGDVSTSPIMRQQSTGFARQWSQSVDTRLPISTSI